VQGQIPPTVTTVVPLPLSVQTFHERFMAYAELTYGPRAVLAPILSASFRMADPPAGMPRDRRDGPGAFARNYGDGVGRRMAKETGRFATGVLLHEDFRYRPSTSRNLMTRGLHALAFTFVDRSDSGASRIAVANFVGAAAGGFVGELYVPPGYNTLGHAEARTALAFGSFAGQNLFREFEPDLQRLAQRWRAPHIPVSAWWVKRNQVTGFRLRGELLPPVGLRQH